MPTTDRAASAILAYQDRSSSNERPLCTSKLNTASERTVSQVRIRVLGDQMWVGDCAHGILIVRTDASDDTEVITDAFRAN